MNKTQKTIDEINAGNESAIIAGISSEIPIVVLNALLMGTKMHIKDDHFIAGVIRAKQDDENKFFGVPMSYYAEAALYCIEGVPYEGSDSYMRMLIESDFKGV